MGTISTSGIAPGSTISATHITNIIEALNGTSATTVVATGSFSGSLTGNLTGTASWATKASTLVSAQNITMTFYTNGAVGSPNYVYGTSGDGAVNNAYATSALIVSSSATASLATKARTVSKDGTSGGSPITFLTTIFGGQPTYVLGTSDGLTNVPLYNPSNFSVASASVATTATTATTATNANAVPFSGITSVPAAIYVAGVSSVATAITGSVDDSKIINGAFYPVDATTGSFNITLNARGGGTDTTIGYEFTVFYKTGIFDVAFVAGAAQTIISHNDYLKLNGTGSAAVAKYIAADTWALIGNLKA